MLQLGAHPSQFEPPTTWFVVRRGWLLARQQNSELFAFQRVSESLLPGYCCIYHHWAARSTLKSRRSPATTWLPESGRSYSKGQEVGRLRVYRGLCRTAQVCAMSGLSTTIRAVQPAAGRRDCEGQDATESSSPELFCRRRTRPAPCGDGCAKNYAHVWRTAVCLGKQRCGRLAVAIRTTSCAIGGSTRIRPSARRSRAGISGRRSATRMVTAIPFTSSCARSRRATSCSRSSTRASRSSESSAVTAAKVPNQRSLVPLASIGARSAGA